MEKCHIKYLLLTSFLILAQSLSGQSKPVIGLHKNPTNIIALTHATIVPQAGEIIEDGTLVVRDGKIEAVGSNIKISADATVKDLNGKTIYPGFIDLFTHYGISEKESNADSKDQLKGTYWNPSVLPDRQAIDLFKVNKNESEVLRKWGFTTVMTAPRNGIFRGTASLILLNDKDINDALIDMNTSQIISFKKGKGISGEGTDSYPASLQGSIAMIRQVFYDADWYQKAWTIYKKDPLGLSKPEINKALSILQPFAKGQKPVIFVTSDDQDVLRVSKLAKEFNINPWVLGSGYEYRRLDAIKNTGLKLIVPVNFPKAPDVSTFEKDRHVNLRTLRHWDAAPENPGRLFHAGIEMALTSSLLKKGDDFLANLRMAVKRGLNQDDALKALTEIPAKWLGKSQQLGSLESGKMANFIITDGNLFDNKTKILETWITGQPFKIQELPEFDLRGKWEIAIETGTKRDTGSINISGDMGQLQSSLKMNGIEIKKCSLKQDNELIELSFQGNLINKEGLSRLTGITSQNQLNGKGYWGDGTAFIWEANLIKPYKSQKDTSKAKEVKMASFSTVYPDGAFGYSETPKQPQWILFQNATVWTAGSRGTLDEADILVKQGKIVSIGPNLKIPKGALVIDATDKHITPGIIDAHSHIAIAGNVNEFSHAIVPEVRIKDVVDCDDINIYRQLASGVTSACILHGSANPIAGSYAVIKLKWGEPSDKMIINEAREGYKFALGENVKQSNFNVKKPRYPITRMGVMEMIEDAFRSALDYRAEWDNYKKNKKGILPRKDLRMEAILEILDETAIIHCHAYRQDEMIALMRLAESFNITVDVFIHVLEGYKLAKEMQEHGAMATIFTDWWTYKMEAFDAIPYNGAILYEQGIVTSFNSDSPELARRLNTEPAKAVKYGNVPPEEAFKFVTLNAAKQLYLDHKIGSLEKGKDADLTIWSGSPLSTYSKCEQTWVEGRQYFSLDKDKELRAKRDKERNVLVQKILRQGMDKKKNK